MITIAIIFPHALEFKSIQANPAKMLKQLQTLVGGYVESLPWADYESEAPYVAYVNEEGLTRGLPANELARKATAALGFYELLPEALRGNVVLMGQDETGLTPLQIREVEKACSL